MIVVWPYGLTSCKTFFKFCVIKKAKKLLNNWNQMNYRDKIQFTPLSESRNDT